MRKMVHGGKKGSESVNKTKTVPIRMSEKDFAIISKKAELSDMTVSEYIRTTALNKQVAGFKMADINAPQEQLRGQLSISDLTESED